MPFDPATGVYTPVVGALNAFPGKIIGSATWNAIFQDISDALTQVEQEILTMTSANSLGFATQVDAVAAVIPVNFDFLFTEGYTTIDDNGAGVYKRVAAAPAHAGKFQSADGAWWELHHNQVITPEHFAAIGDNATDCTAAFKNLAAYVVATGAQQVRFRGGNVTYRVWPFGTLVDQDRIFYLNGTNGVTIDFNGCQIQTDAVWVAPTITRLIYVEGASATGISFNTTIKNLTFYSEQFVALAIPVDTTGPEVILLANSVVNVKMENIKMYGARIGFAASRNSANERASNIAITNMETTKVFYPLSFQKNGDNFTGVNITCHNSGRVYFPYNIYNHKLEVFDDTLGFQVPSVLLTCKCDNTESNYLNTTANIDLTYRSTSQTGTMTTNSLFSIGFQQGTAITSGGTMRDIKIKLDVAVPAALTTNSVLLQTAKTNFAGAADNVARGYNLDNISISGRYDGGTKLVAFADLFADSDWSGEAIRNFSINDLLVTNVGAGFAYGALRVMGSNFGGGNQFMSMTNCQFVAASITFGLPQAMGMRFANVTSANFNSSGAKFLRADGMMQQWDTVSAASNANTTVTFPILFTVAPNVILTANASVSGETGAFVAMTVTASAFQINRPNGVTNPVTVMWRAIGQDI